MFKIAALVAIVLFMIYMVLKIFTGGADIQGSIDEARKELQEKGLICSLFLRYISGVENLTHGAFGTVRLFPDAIVFSASSLHAIIPRKSLEGVYVFTNTELMQDENKGRFGKFSEYIERKYAKKEPKGKRRYLVIQWVTEENEKATYAFEIPMNNADTQNDKAAQFVAECNKK